MGKKRKKKIEKLKEQLARLEEEDEEEEQSKNPLARLFGGMQGLAAGGQLVVEDETTPDRNGERIKFQRPAGAVKKIHFGPDGQPLKVEVEMEEWPPRRGAGETF